MKLKRYTRPELVKCLTNIFMDYMINGGIEEIRKNYIEKVARYEGALELLNKELLIDDSSILERASINEQIGYLNEGINFLKNSSMKSQKFLYEQTGSTDFSRSYARIPLNKRINSFYDDLILEVIFYDNISSLRGKYSEFKELQSSDEIEKFLKENIGITNMGLVYERNSRRISIIEVLGDLNSKDKRVQNSGVILLGQEFSDFENLTLADTNRIMNNDLRQWIQSKIDLDKENMEELSRVFIRGDYYSILKPAESNHLFIRYVCRSTGRVYYEILDLENLKLSDYFKENDYESYAKSWWNLTHLGSKVEGKPIIRC